MSAAKSLPISVTIITKNEETRIQETIQSVIQWVDEVIVVDSESTDRTREIASLLGARVFVNPWPGYGQQKRFAEDLADNDWILNIDADERVLPELAQSIKSEFASDKLKDGYKLGIADQFVASEKVSRHCQYFPVRLYRKSVGRYRDSSVHDRVVMPKSANIGKLEGKIAHKSITSFRQRIEKMNDYTDAQVADLFVKGRKPKKLRVFSEFFWTFLVCFIVRGYWRDGIMGYIYAVNFAYSRFLRQIKLLELYQQKQHFARTDE